MSLAVDRGAGVLAPPGPTNFLEHKRLVAHDDAGAHVSGQLPPLEHPRHFSDRGTRIDVALQVDISSGYDFLLL